MISKTNNLLKILKDKNTTITVIGSLYGFGQLLHYENVIKVLKSKAQPKTHVYDLLKSLALITATYKSSEEGKQIKLPLFQ